MPNPLEADEFDKLLEDNLSEDFLQAASRVEEEALRHCTVPSATLHPVVDDDEYDLILSEDISDEVLLACEEAERPAYPTASIALTFLRPNSPSALPYATVIEYDEYDSLFTDDLSDEFVQAYDEAECSGFSAKDKGPASTSPECKEPSYSLIPRAPTKNDVAPESLVQLTSLKFNEHSCASVPRTPATKTIATRSPISISSGWLSDSSDDDLDDEFPVQSSSRSSPRRLVLEPRKFALAKKGVLSRNKSRIVALGSPISISSSSSDSSEDDSDDSDGVLKSSRAVLPKSVTAKTIMKRKRDVSDEPPHGAKKTKKQNHLEQFFSKYPRFRYDPRATVSDQFNSMCRLYGFFKSKQEWDANRTKTDSQALKREAEREAGRQAADYDFAMSATFDDIFGTDLNHLGSWQSLCRVVKIDPIPQTLWECRAAIRNIHVNLVDLVDFRVTGRPFDIFDTEEELAKYTRDKRKFFPQGRAEKGGLLKFLLRHIV